MHDNYQKLEINLTPPTGFLRGNWTTTLTLNAAMALLATTVFPRAPIFTGFADTLHEMALFKASQLSEALTEHTLALNFLANERSLEPTTRTAFAGSGLTHLLALSGAQVAPVCAVAGGVLGTVLVTLLASHLAPHHLARWVSRLRVTVELTLALTLSALYGSSGAILRVAMFTYLFPVALRSVQTSPALLPDERTSRLIARILVLGVTAVLLGNPYANLSFLLSALGSGLSEMATRLSERHRATGSDLKHRIEKALSNSCATSLLIGVVLYPLFHNNPLVAAAANLVAAPLVGLVITPLSLALLALPEGLSNALHLTTLFDGALATLSSIAQSFAPPDATITPASFSQSGATTYLTVLLVVLWTAQDMRAGKVYLSSGPQAPKDRLR
jgi:predicted membrane metal-binding protein